MGLLALEFILDCQHAFWGGGGVIVFYAENLEVSSLARDLRGSQLQADSFLKRKGQC